MGIKHHEMKIAKANLVLIIFLGIGFFSCEKDAYNSGYITQNVFVVVIDGPRYSETWGDTTGRNIPYMKKISEVGVIYNSFYNNGPTYTLAGHTALTTGYYQEINNAGLELPAFPSMFQYYNRKYSKSKPLSRIFSSKDKLGVLSDCIDSTWNGYFRPLTDCGVNGTGIGSGYRDDSLTFSRTLNILSVEHPRFILLSFREPDNSAHQGNWESYIRGIKKTDEYVYQLWNFIKEDNYYRGKTAMIITNDHGRHLDNISDGFVSHGDTCEGCRHISLLAYGPDFKRGEVINLNRELIDIPATIAGLLRFSMPTGQGVIMKELFK
jgi:hypothetical protein